MANLDVAIAISGRDTGATAVLTRVQQSLSGIQQATRETTSAFSSMWGSLNQGIGIAAGFAVFQAGASALSAAKDAAIGFNQTIDGARATMARYFADNESVNASIANLNTLAAKTPFAFEGLLTAQQRTIGAARSAKELEQNMDAIAVVAANTGRVSTANMERISLALGQMQAKGHLAGGEMLQLTEAGVNMTEILTKHFGVTSAQLQKMISDGKVSAQEVFAAMREFASDPKNRQAMEGLAHTWEGAWSTINDVMRTTIAQTFRPFFDLLTQGADALATFLQTEEFRAWAEALRLGFVSVADGVKSLLSGLAPLGEAIKTAFGQATQGDFSGAFATLTSGFQQAFAAIGEAINSFTQEMFGAGANLIQTFASGIIEGGVAAVQAAVDTVATIIASFLIGQSPPPQGPLSDIDKGGKTLMETYGQGMQQGLGPAKAAVEALDDQIREVGKSIADLDFQQTDLKRSVQDIKDAYEDQLDPLKRQLEVLQQQRDEGEKQIKLQFQQRELRLRELEIEAKGDPEQRAAITAQLETIKNRQKELGLQDDLADIEQQKKKLAADGSKAQLEDMQYTRQRASLEQRLHDAKDKSQKDSIKSQIQELDLRHKMAQDDRTNDQAAAARKKQQLDLRADEIKAQQQLDGLTDKGKLAELAHDRELLGLDKERAAIAQAQKDIENDNQRQAILDQIRALKDEEKARLDPMEEQLKSLQRQRDALEEVRKKLQLQKQDAQDVLQAYQEQERAAKAAATAAKKEGLPEAPGRPAGGLKVDLDPVEKAIQEKIAGWGKKITEGISDEISKNGGTLIAAAIGAVLGGIAFGPLGAIVGAGLGVAIWDSVNKKLAEAGFDSSPVIARIIEGVKTGKWDEVGAALLDGFKGAMGAIDKLVDQGGNVIFTWLNKQIETIDWDTLGRDFGKAFGEWLTGSSQKGADSAGADIVHLNTRALSDGISKFFNAALDAAWKVILDHWRDQEPGSSYSKVFIDGLDADGWVGAIKAVIVRLEKEWEDHRQTDYDNLKAWLAKNGEAFGAAYADWRIRQQGVIDDLVAQWNEHRATDAQRWDAWTTEIGNKLKTAWEATGGAMLQGFQNGVQNFWTNTLEPWLNGAGQWIVDAFQKYVGGPLQWLVQIGKEILQGLQNGISNSIAGFKTWLEDNLISQIPEWIKSILKLQADTGAMALVGERMVEEIEIGMKNRWPSLESLIKRLSGRLTGISLDDTGLDDLLRVAMGYAGIGDDSWLPGLRWIIAHESGGDPTAQNPGSTAAGLFQLLDSTWASYRDLNLTDNVYDAFANAVAGLKYISSRYGNADAAQAFWEENSYYKKGGLIDEMVYGVGESGKRYTFHGSPSEPESVFDAQTTAAIRRNGFSGAGVDEGKLVQIIAEALHATRPIVNQGTSEELAAKMQRTQIQERRTLSNLRGVRTRRR